MEKAEKGGKEEMKGEWSDSIQAFWCGGMDVEYVAWKGSHQIFVFPCNDYPNPPTEIIHHTERIETVKEFNKALKDGKRFIATYKEGE